ncbi:hypothetical protein Krac_2359 [Ktedonobacter racemifer DSM 44963]|uniref:Uncharacterized protein n=1 Tax=Ktedonobacter racemifer DSM 44963 TaxID=485913 RepID=D6U544_KTERA|nr:hypothetical protein Krac_2359 [Ktedonobacter racemifer DSM 44963]
MICVLSIVMVWRSQTITILKTLFPSKILLKLLVAGAKSLSMSGRVCYIQRNQRGSYSGFLATPDPSKAL